MPSRRRSSTIVRPIGFGRSGDRVANTPCGRLSEGVLPSNSNPWERSNSQITMRCEKPSMSVSPGSNSGRILSTPSASCLAPRPLGISLAFLYGLLTNPIGCEVNIRDRAPISHANADKAAARISLDRNDRPDSLQSQKGSQRSVARSFMKSLTKDAAVLALEEEFRDFGPAWLSRTAKAGALCISQTPICLRG